MDILRSMRLFVLVSDEMSFTQAARTLDLTTGAASRIISALEHGMGVGALPLHRVVEALGTGRLKRVLPDHHLQPLKIYALFPSRQFLDAKVRTWLDHLKLHFGKAAERERTVLAALAA